MALIPAAHKALIAYAERINDSGAPPPKHTIRRAVILTEMQRVAIEGLLRALWRSNDFACPLVLDLKPQHAYESRVVRDGYASEQLVEWITAGCADVALVNSDARGRPNLLVPGVRDEARTFDLLVPIRSVADGYVYIDDVIPRGLVPRQKK